MAHQREGGWFVCFEVVAAVASVEEGRCGKLPGVAVRVAIGAALKLDPEQRVLALGNVALRAFHPRVSALQRICTRSVFLHREGGRLPPVQVVTGGALPAIGPFSKLPVMRIGLVAIHALRKDQRLLEVTVGMALGAIQGEMFSLQRIFCLGVVEALVHGSDRNLLPSRSVVAGLAALREASAMRIFVAVRALVEGNAHVSRFAVFSIDVALRALNLRVPSGQGIARLRVIELANGDRLPIGGVVALLAIGAEAALVLVFVARDATGRETEIGPARILDFDRRSFLRRDVGCVVALVTAQAGMLAFEQVSGFLVIEGLDVPLDQWKILAIVLGVTARALLAGAGRKVVSRMQPLVGIEPAGNFRVAVQTFERGLAAELMATGAVG